MCGIASPKGGTGKNGCRSHQEVRLTTAGTLEIRLETLRFPKDRPVYLRLRFRDAEEYFAFTFQPGPGLRLVPVKNTFSKVKGSIRDFANMEFGAGQRDYECNNFNIIARWRQGPLDPADPLGGLAEGVQDSRRNVVGAEHQV
jgi:hypothetical protein